jgi:hypothetical protein
LFWREQLVLFIPDFIGKTSDARAVLEVGSFAAVDPFS